MVLGPATIPQRATVLVIGGGPAGSYAATVLAREGINVVLLEKDVFPRYHIGESMLPSCRQFLRLIGAEEIIQKRGFTPKPGAAVKLNQHKREGYTDFVGLYPENGAWNVVRSEFDECLLRYASQCGVSVYEGVQVTGIQFGAGSDAHPESASWETKTGAKGTLAFDWLVDASGRTGIISTKYLKNRRFNESLRNFALWSYWKGAGQYSPGTTRENAPWFEALTDETGWAWFIPLHNGTVSVGIVMTEESHRSKKAQVPSESNNKMAAHYLAQLDFVPGLKKLLGTAEMCDTVKSAGDYSYSAGAYAGPHYRIAGDAAAFIDPFFSSGVHLAFTDGLSAATSIVASIRHDCTEEEAAAYHNVKVGISYTRFLLVVLGIYKQIKCQATPVLSDINEDNFDRAFNMLRPVIQGAVDVDPNLTEDELQETMDFCKNVFAPTDPAMHARVIERLDPSLTATDSPILSTDAVSKLAAGDEEVEAVLLELNARKPIHAMYNCEHQFTTEVLAGFYAKLERGKIGLVRA